MSRTTPVRWWRDDATRYHARPLIGVCRSWSQPDANWQWLALPPMDPGMSATLDRLRELASPENIARAMMLPPEVVNRPLQADPWGYRGGSLIEDVMHGIRVMEREVAAESAGNPIEEIRVGETDGARAVIGRHRDGTFTVLESTTKPRVS